MPLEVRATRLYPVPTATVYQAALAAVADLRGQVLHSDPTQGRLEARFDKKLRGKILGDRTQIEIQIDATATAQSSVAVLVYPLDVLNRQLLFGARKGVPETVLSWFFKDLERHLA